MSTEVILMECVKAGGDRQELHELIREHSMDAARVVKEQGGDNDLIGRIKADPAFAAIKDRIDGLLAPENFIGRAKEQTLEYLRDEVKPMLEKNKDCLGATSHISV